MSETPFAKILVGEEGQTICIERLKSSYKTLHSSVRSSTIPKIKEVACPPQKRASMDTRQGPNDDLAPVGGKRAKKHGEPGSSTSAVENNDLRVFIMLEPFYDLTKEQSMEIKRKVKRAYDETIFSKDSTVRTPNFRKKTLMNKGVIEMCCEDEFALEWLRKIIADTPSPRSDAKLVVRRQREL